MLLIYPVMYTLRKKGSLAVPQVEPLGAYCIKVLPEKNSGYFNRCVFPVVKSMVKIMLT